MRAYRLVAMMCVLAAPRAVAAEPHVGSTRPCQQSGSDDGVVQGRLGLLEGLGPAAFIITVPGGLCVTGTTAAETIDGAVSVQLYSLSAEGMQKLYGLVGQRVTAKGKLTVGSNYQQKAPVLMEVLDIAAK